MELRVHGVGGPSAQSVLGLRRTDRVVASWRSQPGAKSAVRRRSAWEPGGDDVQAYHWAPLTSGSKSFALWPLLLPFTLLNVAGWMHPAADERRGQVRATLARVIVDLLGYLLTAGLVVWLLFAGQVLAGASEAVLDTLAWLPGELPAARRWFGIVVSAALLAVIFFAATYTARGYERFRPPSWDGPARPPRRVRRPGGTFGLSNARFYDNGADHSWRWRSHLLLAAATFVAVGAALVTEGGTRPYDAIAWAISGVGAVQFGLVSLLFAVLLQRRPWALMGAAVATSGLALVGGIVISATSFVVDVDGLPPGPTTMLYDAYGWAVAVAGATALVCLGARLLTPIALERDAERCNSLLPTVVARLRARLARYPQRAAAAALAFALTFLLVGSASFLVRIWDEEEREQWRLTETLPVDVARTTLLVLIGFMVVNVVKSRANPDRLRRVGTVWDILTFWPRTFHPLAVRPYAERAVPELAEFLRRFPGSGTLVVTAHSQGSVLTYAALLPFADRADDHVGGPPWRPGRIRVVSMGSPLRSLYALAFPHYFRTEHFEHLRGEVPWTNVFRHTDYIGRAVFSDTVTDPDPYDYAIPDPPVGQSRARVHSDYWTDEKVRSQVSLR